ncbi:Lar family restriction alleviation protein [Azotobacter beijerinckii]|uniref:Lar family restriction alleviation protein n=1 Tax=Azotobacter beijerinckii TaxID=170623 RepID=UPI0029535FAD|nr:Lar family restriction alleviation protein [Azotobacter beijerinckii]MDV7209926.1 Lar family restriction alleviation protein [Azotobacter beijerinckii]
MSESNQIELHPCPFCEGPPAVIVTNAEYPYGEAARQSDYGDEGHWVEGYVFCHECGADGPKHEELIFDAEGYDEVKRAGARLWQERNDRHRSLYDASKAEGLNLYPRGPANACRGE